MIPINIQQLIDRFLDGTSTLAEERTLASYLSTHGDEPELKELAEMFRMFDAGLTEVPPVSASQSSVSAPVPPSRHRWIPAASFLAAVAASLLLIFQLFSTSDTESTGPTFCPQTTNEDHANQLVAEVKEDVTAETSVSPKKHVAPAKNRTSAPKAKLRQSPPKAEQENIVSQPTPADTPIQKPSPTQEPENEIDIDRKLRLIAMQQAREMQAIDRLMTGRGRELTHAEYEHP